MTAELTSPPRLSDLMEAGLPLVTEDRSLYLVSFDGEWFGCALGTAATGATGNPAIASDEGWRRTLENAGVDVTRPVIVPELPTRGAAHSYKAGERLPVDAAINRLHCHNVSREDIIAWLRSEGL